MSRRISIAHVILTSTLLLTGPHPAGWSGSPGQPAAGGQAQPQHTKTLLPDGTWLLTGGHGAAASSIVIADPQSGTVVPITAGLLAPRSGHTATVLPDGTVLIAGGVAPDGRLVTTVERFDPSTWTIDRVETPLDARAFHTATVLTDGRVLLAGGVDGQGRALATAELFDPIGATAVDVGSPLHRGRAGHRAELLEDGRVLLTGGAGRGGDDIYDPAADAFDAGGRPDETPDTRLAASIPRAGDTGLPLDVRIALRFSRPLDPSTVDGRAIQLHGPVGPVAVDVVTVESGMLTFVRPRTELAPEQSYTVFVQLAAAADGTAVVPTSFTFSTAAAPTRPVESEDDESWIPGADELSRSWRTGRPPSPWESVPLLEARPGVTAVSGRVLSINGRPLPGFRVRVGGHDAVSDRMGRFLVEEAPAGRQELVIDGRSGSVPGRSYGVFRIGLDLVEGRTNKLPYTNWMTRIDLARAVTLPSPTVSATVVATPRIPGLELHVPAGAVVRDHEGHVSTQISITPIPVDRPPFPLPPGVDVPIYFTVQPGGGHLDGQTGGWPAAARLIYPNYRRWRAGTRIDFWQYDPEDRGWFVYGQGTVSADGRRVVPDAGVKFYEFTGAMVGSPSFGPGEGPKPCNPCEDGDPVDLGTGLFLHRKTDVYLPDAIPIAVTRTYRTRDTRSRAFGVGSTHPYEIFLVGDTNPWTFAEIILPDGGRVYFPRTSAGTGFSSAVYKHTTTPSRFYNSEIRWNGNGWNLTFNDGTVFTFPDGEFAATPAQAAVRSIRDRFGNRLTLDRDAESKLTRIQTRNGRWVAFTYDGSGRITQARDNIARTTTYEYDASGRLWKVTDPGLGVTEYTYDSAHRIKTIKDPRGFLYVTNYYDINGRVIQQTLPDGSVYRFAYTLDGSGKVTRTDVTDPRNYVRSVTFNPDGYWMTDTKAQGKPEQQALTVEREPGTNFILKATDALNRRTTYAYDTVGNLRSITEMWNTAEAVTTTATYDPTYNQLASVTRTVGSSTLTTTLSYDSRGALIGVEDPLHHTTTVENNDAGQPTAITTPAGTTRLTYEAGDVVEMTNPLGDSLRRMVDGAGREVTRTDAAGQTAAYEYNALDLLTKITDPLQGASHFEYDANRNLKKITDPRNGVSEYTYDSLDRVATRKDPLLREERFTYDRLGNLLQATDRKGQTTTYTYDGLGRLTTASYADGSSTAYTYDGGDRLRQIADTAGGTVVRDYDNFDRLSLETTPSGSVSYTYDAAGRRQTMTVAGQPTVIYTHDDADRLTRVEQGTAFILFDYDAANRRTKLELSNGIRVEYDYDAASQLKCITYKLGATVLGTLTYDYDASGRRTQMGGSFARTQLPDALSATTYDAANQLRQWGASVIDYDANGNITSDGSRTYGWDARNRLSAIGGASAAAFEYDGLTRRTEKQGGGAPSTRYLYDEASVVQELTGTTPVANILRGTGVDEAVLRSDATGTSTLLRDALGSTIALADGAGALVTQYTYAPFGAVAATGAVNANASQYGGRENDGTGVYYYRARFYDPRLARFISEDPRGFADGFNPYAYVHNDPIRLIDPTGEYSQTACVLSWMGSLGTIGAWMGATAGATAGLAGGGVAAIPGGAAGAVGGGMMGAGLGGMIGGAVCPPDDPIYCAEHTKGKRPSTKEKHEEGVTRKKKDRGGEKGDDERRPPRRPPPNWRGPWPPKPGTPWW